MVIHTHDPILLEPLMNDGITQSNFGSPQPMLRSPIEIASKITDIEPPSAGHVDVELRNAAPVAGDQESMEESAMSGNVDIQKPLRFEASLGYLERMLVLRQIGEPDTRKALDDIIRTQIDLLIQLEWHVPADRKEYLESSMLKYLERIAEVRKNLSSQWLSMDHNGWNGDRDCSAKSIDFIMAHLMWNLDIHSNSGLVRDIHPLMALEILTNVKEILYNKQFLEKPINNLIGQKIYHLFFLQHSQLSMVNKHAGSTDSGTASEENVVKVAVDRSVYAKGKERTPCGSCVTQDAPNKTVDASDCDPTEAMHTPRTAEDTTANLQSQVANLQKELNQAKERVSQAESNSLQHPSNVRNFPSNANAWATPPSSSVPTSWIPSTFKAPMPDTLGSPCEASKVAPPTTNKRPTNVPMLSYPRTVCHEVPDHAAPSGLFGSPMHNRVYQSPYVYGDVGHGLGHDDHRTFGPLNTGFRPMVTRMPPHPMNAVTPAGRPAVKQTERSFINDFNGSPPYTAWPSKQAFDEAHKQARGASLPHLRGQSGLTRANQGARRRGGLHNDCEHQERLNRDVRGGRAYHGRHDHGGA